MDEDKFNALWCAIVKWAASSDATDTGEKGKLWEADTVTAAGLGPYKARINRSKKTIGYMPPFSAAVIDHKRSIEVVALCDPRGGFVFLGVTEDELIAHFDAQPALEHHA